MIRIEHLCKRYGGLTVLKDINAEIEKGEIITIIGPSGSGKSTLLRCLNLLERPSGGSIYIDNTDLLARGTDVPGIRRKMGMVFQSFNLYAHLSVLENLTLAPVKLLGKGRAEAAGTAVELLKLVGLAEKAHSFPDELSGGQKQRVAIARCLAMEPEVILFDEPTSALDPAMTGEVLAVIRRLAGEGMTMLVVTHEMEFARNLSTRVFYLDEGVIYEQGPPEQIFEKQQKEKTRAFINRVRSYHYRINSPDYDLYAMNGEIAAFCSKHYLSRAVCDNVLLLAEEILLLQRDFTEITLTLAYHEKTGKLEVLCAAAGAPFNPLERGAGADDIGQKLIQSRSAGSEYRYEEGKNILSVFVRGMNH